MLGDNQERTGPDGPECADLGGIIRQIRRVRDLSQRELAELVGLSRSTIARLETGEFRGTVAVLNSVLGATGMRLAVLDEHGQEVQPMRKDVPRTNGGNRYPAHLDARIPTMSPWQSAMGLGIHPERKPRVLWYSLRPARDEQQWVRARPPDHPSWAEYLRAKAAHWPSREAPQAG